MQGIFYHHKTIFYFIFICFNYFYFYYFDFYCFRFDSESRVTARWYSSWVVIFSFLPLVVLYAIWIPATLDGRINSTTITKKSLSQLDQSTDKHNSNKRKKSNNLDQNNNNNNKSNNINSDIDDSNHSDRSNTQQNSIIQEKKKININNDQKSILLSQTPITVVQSPLYIDGDQSSHSIHL